MARFIVQEIRSSSDPIDTLIQGETSEPRVVSLFDGLKSVELSGVFDGASVSVQGRIGVDWSDLALGLTLTGIYTFEQPMRELRVIVVGGGGSTAIKAIIAGFNSRSI